MTYPASLPWYLTPLDIHDAVWGISGVVYGGALHGFGVRPVSNPCGTWTRSCTDWMRHQGFLKASTP